MKVSSFSHAPNIISRDMTSIAARMALGMNMVMCSLKGEIVNFLETTMSMVIVGKKFGIYSDRECNLAVSDLPFYPGKNILCKGERGLSKTQLFWL